MTSNIYIIEFFDVTNDSELIGQMTSTTIAEVKAIIASSHVDFAADGYINVKFKVSDFKSGATIEEGFLTQT